MSFSSVAGKLLTSLIGGGKPVLEDQNGLTVELDAVIEDVRGSGAVVSKHAVEGDSETTNVADHVKADEAVLNLKIVLTNHFVTSVLKPASLLKTAKGTLFKLDDTIQDRLDIIDSWRTHGDLLKYTSKRRTFDSCVITKLDDAVTKETGDGRAVTMTLEKITIANADEINIELKKPSGARSAPKKSRSLLKKIFS